VRLVVDTSVLVGELLRVAGRERLADERLELFSGLPFENVGEFIEFFSSTRDAFALVRTDQLEGSLLFLLNTWKALNSEQFGSLRTLLAAFKASSRAGHADTLRSLETMVMDGLHEVVFLSDGPDPLGIRVDLYQLGTGNTNDAGTGTTDASTGNTNVTGNRANE
jgi:hypothetical protein